MTMPDKGLIAKRPPASSVNSYRSMDSPVSASVPRAVIPTLLLLAAFSAIIFSVASLSESVGASSTAAIFMVMASVSV